MGSKFSKSYFLGALTQALKQGTTPRKLAITCALGIVIGIFPVMGTTTLLCFVLSVLLKLNVAVIQLVNYLITPLQVILIFPLIKTGTYVFGLKTFSYNQEQLTTMFRNDFWALLKESGIAIAGGAGIWLLISIPLFLLLFYFFFFILNKLIKSGSPELKVSDEIKN